MMVLWGIGVVDSLTAFEFVTNVGVQYGSISMTTAIRSERTVPLSVLIAPIRGVGVASKYIMTAQGKGERIGRIQDVAIVFAMSGRMSLTNPGLNGPAGVTISNFIRYMDSMIKKTGNNGAGLVFCSPTTFSNPTALDIVKPGSSVTQRFKTRPLLIS